MNYLQNTDIIIRVIGATAAQLVVFWNAFPNPNITGSQWLPMLCNQLVICLSVVDRYGDICTRKPVVISVGSKAETKSA